MYIKYKDWIQNEFGDGQGIVHDNSWWGYVYFSAQTHPKMKVIHSHHGMTNWVDASGKPSLPAGIVFPRLMGVSSQHAQYLSDFFHIPVRHVHNGIDIPPKPDPFPHPDQGYLLSLNRITKEKGIHNSIDIATATGNKIILAGDDVNVFDQNYVWEIKQRAENSGGLVEYVGLVDTVQKWELIKNCKAMISCPESGYVEAFGIYALEAGAMGKPVLGFPNGGLRDTVINNENGFLGNNTEDLKNVIRKGILDDLAKKAENCRKIVEDNFTISKVTKDYINLYQQVLEDNPSARW